MYSEKIKYISADVSNTIQFSQLEVPGLEAAVSVIVSLKFPQKIVCLICCSLVILVLSGLLSTGVRIVLNFPQPFCSLCYNLFLFDVRPVNC